MNQQTSVQDGRTETLMADTAGRERPVDTSSVPEEVLVSVRNLRKVFRREDGSTTNALDDVSFDVRSGEFLVLLGPSGCGKTTLLRCVAGLETPNEGTIAIHGRTVFSSADKVVVPTEQRGISMIFQSYALWPHMTVFDNIAYALRTGKRSERKTKGEISDAVMRVLALVGIPELSKQYPGQMSGGQQQRVALARALVAGTGLILFDEPLSNVDAKVRDLLRTEIVAMQRNLGFSAIYVTHDQEEAMAMAHRIAVMSKGRILQLDGPVETYHAPASLEVARFVGKTNEVEGSVTEVGNGRVVVRTAFGEMTAESSPDDVAVGQPVTVIWRPEFVTWSRTELSGPNTLTGRLVGQSFLGSYTEYLVDVVGQSFMVHQAGRRQLAIGETVWMTVDSQEVTVLSSGNEAGGG